jgi:hypothetical protein
MDCLPLFLICIFSFPVLVDERRRPKIVRVECMGEPGLGDAGLSLPPVTRLLNSATPWHTVCGVGIFLLFSH